MAFFRSTRDQLKANAFISHLEFAKQRFRPRDMILCEQHLAGAHKAFQKFCEAEADYILSASGWEYVARLAGALQRELTINGFEEHARQLERITWYAVRAWGDRENPCPESFEDQKPAPPMPLRDPFEAFENLRRRSREEQQGESEEGNPF